MSEPKISVILPVFNGEKFLKETIESILNQTYKNFELLIINDASTDKTAQILDSLSDPRIKIIQNDVNQGVTKSLNKGLQAAKGQYIARCDSDDINELDRFEKQINFLETNQEYVMVGSNALWIDQTGKKIAGFSVYEKDQDIRRHLLFRNQFFHPSVMFRKQVLKKTGIYREIFNGVEDYDLWFRMIKAGKVYNFPDQLIKRRVHENVVTKKNHWKIELLALVVRMINLIA